MNKLKINFIVDLLLFLSFFVSAISGLIILIFLPGGFPRAGQQMWLNITRREWIDVHHVAGIITIILVLVHLILHWRWMVQAVKSVCSKHSQNNQIQ